MATRLDAAEVGDTRDPTALVDRDRRLHELDGIRGWAALAVVVFHLCYETFGIVFPSR